MKNLKYKSDEPALKRGFIFCSPEKYPVIGRCGLTMFRGDFLERETGRRTSKCQI